MIDAIFFQFDLIEPVKSLPLYKYFLSFALPTEFAQYHIKSCRYPSMAPYNIVKITEILILFLPNLIMKVPTIPRLTWQNIIAINIKINDTETPVGTYYKF